MHADVHEVSMQPALMSDIFLNQACFVAGVTASAAEQQAQPAA
jgi:hypothetical protein